MNELFNESSQVTLEQRNQFNQHRSALIWLTGLSGSGKSTLAYKLEKELFQQGKQVVVLDGDNIRLGLNQDLGFSDADRAENIRRVGEVCQLFLQVGFIVIAAFISPFRLSRQRVKEIVKPHRFFEIFLDCPFEVCQQRDPKGLYKKVQDGHLPQFTGVDSIYEPPLAPALKLNTAQQSIVDCNKDLLHLLIQEQIIQDFNQPIFHIASQAEWEHALTQGFYTHPSLKNEGFIHCSTREQLLVVANHHYRGVKDLLLLEIEPGLLQAQLKFEGQHEGVGQNFPHLYGVLNLKAVKTVLSFPCQENGQFQLPPI